MSLAPTREDQAFSEGYRQASTSGGMVIDHLIDRLHKMEAQKNVLVKALQDIKAATLDGRVCDDVAWFGPGETLHDFCDSILALVGGSASE